MSRVRIPSKPSSDAAVQPRTGPGVLCILCPGPPSISETFIRAHIERLPGPPVAIWGWRPSVGDQSVLSWSTLLMHKLWRVVRGETTLERQTTAAYIKAFRRYKAMAALAEYGDHAIHAIRACHRVGIPLIAHFHGYDASLHSVLQANAATYPVLFREAAAIIAVSRAMQERLHALGASPNKVHYNPYGVDCDQLRGGAPAAAPPTLVAVGRFTEKKAPQLTLLAFAKALVRCPEARLRMVGDGPLREACLGLARGLGIAHAVTFMGAQPPLVVREELRAARAFVQHSVEAPSGDSEGTPVAALEAGATGLPVISTRHGGIPDVVVEGETGLLVDEHDVEGMAAHMVTVLADPELAGRLGQAARHRIETQFSIDQSLGRLTSIIEECVATYSRRPAKERTGGVWTSVVR